MHVPLLTACESVSSTSTPAPSLITNPPRFRSKGRDARVGRSLKAVFIAIKLQKPAKLSGVSGASVPPSQPQEKHELYTMIHTYTMRCGSTNLR